MTNEEKDKILTEIAQIPMSDPIMDSTRNMMCAYLAARIEVDEEE